MDLSAVDDTTFVQELKGQDPEDRPLLDSNTAARIIEIFRKVSCQIGESEECEDFDSILGIIFDYVVQQRERNPMDATSPDLKFLLDANLVHALSDVYLSLFPQIRTVGPIAERSLDCLFKTMLCIFEEHSPAKREFANRCLPRMYQDWFAPGYNAHPAAVYHMMEVVESLFIDDEILNRFWFNHDAATEKARLLLRFAFEQSLVLFSLINKCRLNHSQNSFLEEAISLANITSIPEGVTSKKLCEAFQHLRHRGANTIDDASLNKIAKQLLEACKIVYRPYNVATLWLNTNEFFVRHFEITRRGLSALIVPQSDPELEPEFLFTDRRALTLEHHKDQNTVILTLSAPLHPCLAKHFEDSEDDDSDQDTSAGKGRGTKGEDSDSMLITLEFKSDEIAEEFSTSFQAQSAEDDFSMSQRSDVPRNVRPICDIAVMDKEGNPVILFREPGDQIKGHDFETVGNSTVFGSQGASINVCPDSLAGVCDRSHGLVFSQGSNIVPSTQDEENLLSCDPSYCQEKCITAESIKASGIDGNHMDECSDVADVLKKSRKNGASGRLFDDDQDPSAKIKQAEGTVARTAQEIELDPSLIEGNQGARERSRLAMSSDFSDNTSSSALTAVSFPKLGKKAESLSVKELKAELGKRGQPIDGNKKELVSRIRKFESDSAAQIMKDHIQTSETTRMDSQIEPLMHSKGKLGKVKKDCTVSLNMPDQTIVDSKIQGNLSDKQDTEKRNKTKLGKGAIEKSKDMDLTTEQTPNNAICKFQQEPAQQVIVSPVSGPLSPRSERQTSKSSNSELPEKMDQLPNLLADEACQRLHFSPLTKEMPETTIIEDTAQQGPVENFCEGGVDNIADEPKRLRERRTEQREGTKHLQQETESKGRHNSAKKKNGKPVPDPSSEITHHSDDVVKPAVGDGLKVSARPYSKPGKGKRDVYKSNPERSLSADFGIENDSNSPLHGADKSETTNELSFLDAMDVCPPIGYDAQVGLQDYDALSANRRSIQEDLGQSNLASAESDHDLSRASRGKEKKISELRKQSQIPQGTSLNASLVVSKELVQGDVAKRKGKRGVKSANQSVEVDCAKETVTDSKGCDMSIEDIESNPIDMLVDTAAVKGRAKKTAVSSLRKEINESAGLKSPQGEPSEVHSDGIKSTSNDLGAQNEKVQSSRPYSKSGKGKSLQKSNPKSSPSADLGIENDSSSPVHGADKSESTNPLSFPKAMDVFPHIGNDTQAGLPDSDVATAKKVVSKEIVHGDSDIVKKKGRKGLKRANQTVEMDCAKEITADSNDCDTSTESKPVDTMVNTAALKGRAKKTAVGALGNVTNESAELNHNDSGQKDKSVETFSNGTDLTVQAGKAHRQPKTVALKSQVEFAAGACAGKTEVQISADSSDSPENEKHYKGEVSVLGKTTNTVTLQNTTKKEKKKKSAEQDTAEVKLGMVISDPLGAETVVKGDVHITGDPTRKTHGIPDSTVDSLMKRKSKRGKKETGKNEECKSLENADESKDINYTDNTGLASTEIDRATCHDNAAAVVESDQPAEQESEVHTARITRGRKVMQTGNKIEVEKTAEGRRRGKVRKTEEDTSSSNISVVKNQVGLVGDNDVPTEGCSVFNSENCTDLGSTTTRSKKARNRLESLDHDVHQQKSTVSPKEDERLAGDASCAGKSKVDHVAAPETEEMLNCPTMAATSKENADTFANTSKASTKLKNASVEKAKMKCASDQIQEENVHEDEYVTRRGRTSRKSEKCASEQEQKAGRKTNKKGAAPNATCSLSTDPEERCEHTEEVGVTQNISMNVKTRRRPDCADLLSSSLPLRTEYEDIEQDTSAQTKREVMHDTQNLTVQGRKSMKKRKGASEASGHMNATCSANEATKRGFHSKDADERTTTKKETIHLVGKVMKNGESSENPDNGIVSRIQSFESEPPEDDGDKTEAAQKEQKSSECELDPDMIYSRPFKKKSQTSFKKLNQSEVTIAKSLIEAKNTKKGNGKAALSDQLDENDNIDICSVPTETIGTTDADHFKRKRAQTSNSKLLETNVAADDDERSLVLGEIFDEGIRQNRRRKVTAQANPASCETFLTKGTPGIHHTDLSGLPTIQFSKSAAKDFQKSTCKQPKKQGKSTDESFSNLNESIQISQRKSFLDTKTHSALMADKVENKHSTRNQGNLNTQFQDPIFENATNLPVACNTCSDIGMAGLNVTMVDSFVQQSRARPYSKSGLKSKLQSIIAKPTADESKDSEQFKAITDDCTSGTAISERTKLSESNLKQVNDSFDEFESYSELKEGIMAHQNCDSVMKTSLKQIQSAKPEANRAMLPSDVKETIPSDISAVTGDDQSCSHSTEKSQVTVPNYENRRTVGKKRNSQTINTTCNQENEMEKDASGIKRKISKASRAEKNTSDEMARNRCSDVNSCKVGENEIKDSEVFAPETANALQSVPRSDLETILPFTGPKLSVKSKEVFENDHMEEQRIIPSLKTLTFSSFDARCDDTALETRIPSRIPSNQSTNEFDINQGRETRGDVNLEEENGRNQMDAGNKNSVTEEVTQSRVAHDQQTSQNRSKSTLHSKTRNTIEARSNKDDLEGRLKPADSRISEQSNSTEVIYSSEKGGTDTDAHSDLQTNKSTTSTVFKGKTTKTAWGSAFSPNEYAHSRITCDSDSCSAMGLDDADITSVNGSEMLSIGSAVSPLVPKQLRFVSEQENVFKSPNSCQWKQIPALGESDSEGDDFDSGLCQDEKLGRFTGASRHNVLDQLNHLCTLFAQKQGEALKSQAKAENASLMSRSEQASSNYTRLSSDLAAKFKQATLKFREQRSKILQRSLRLARDHTSKSNSLRQCILANQKKLCEIRKFNAHNHKEKLRGMSNRAKRFRDIQAAEEKRIKYKAQMEQSSSSSNMQQIQALLGTFFAA